MFAMHGLGTEHTRAVLKPGTLAEPWLTGGPNCLAVPDWQVHEYNKDFYILRESGCINAEKPFLYLIFGEDKALLEDTGVASATPEKTVVPTAPVIMNLMEKWAKRKHHAPVSSAMIHSHSHGDHGRGTYQIDEAPLELTRAHVFELNDAFVSMHGENKVVAMPDFTLVPRGKTDETAYPPELRPMPKTN